MRRLWIASLILLALFLASVWNAGEVRDRTEHVITLLEQAEASLEAGDRETALALMEQANSDWETHDLFFQTVLNHSIVDQVSIGLQEALAYLQDRETGGEYSAASAALMQRLQMMMKMERLTLGNLL